MEDIDSSSVTPSDENSTKMGNEKTVWKRYKKRQYVTPDAEYANLIRSGGRGITEPFELGRNQRGDLLVVPPLTESEELLQIPKNKCQSFETHAFNCVKSLVFRLPDSESNDVASFEPSHDLDGTRRPQLPAGFELKKNDQFIDTIIAVGKTSSKASVIDYFFCFNLHENGTWDARNKISMSMLPGKHKVHTPGISMQEVRKWKIMLADVPMTRMKWLFEVYCLGIKWKRQPKSKAEIQELLKMFSSEDWVSDVDFSNLTKAAELVRDGKFTMLELDMTEDIRGTLDAEDFTEVVVQQGFEIEENSRCGKNCVKYRDPSDTSYKPKVYNKVAETMQQGAVRDKGVSCKLDKLLEPSTANLKEKFYDSDYHNHGITRLEITFMLNEKLPNWAGMQKKLDSHASVLKTTGTLVTCSFHDHMKDMSDLVKTSAVVFFPDVFKEKRQKWVLCRDKNMNQLSKSLQSYPDAVLARWHNRDTGKINGISINAIHDSRSPDADGWHRTALYAAACCTSADPVLFVCIAGSEQWFGQEGPEHMYFRRVALKRVPLHPKMTLDTVFLTKSNLSSACDFVNLGVDIDSQPWRPRILKPSQLCPNEIQTDIEIDGNVVLENLNDLQSEGTEAVCKWSGIRKLSADFLSADFKPVKQLTIKTQGIHGPKACFNLEGDKFWVPKEKQEAVKPYADRANIIFLVRWGQNGFEFTVEDCEISGQEELEVHVKWSGKQSNSDKIPVQAGPQAIKSIGFQQLKGHNLSSYVQLDGQVDRYWLPASVTEAIIMRLQQNKIEITDESTKKEYQYLNGYFLKRTEDMQKHGKVRVTGQRNAEILISIVDDQGRTYVSQRLTEYGKKRKIDQIS